MTPSQLALLVRSLSRIPRAMQLGVPSIPDPTDLLGKTGLPGLRGSLPIYRILGAGAVISASAVLAVVVSRLRQVNIFEETDGEELPEVDDEALVDEFLRRLDLESAPKDPRTAQEERDTRVVAEKAVEDYLDSRKAALPPSQAAGAPERPVQKPNVDTRGSAMSSIRERFEQLRSILPSEKASIQASGGSTFSTGQLRKVYIPGSDVMGALRDASSLSGVPLSLLLSVAEAESFFNTSVKADKGSASGLFQFIESTWSGIVKQYGKNPEMIERFGKNGITVDMKDNALAQAILGAYYVRDNLATLKRKGYPTTSTEAYMMHFLGPGDAIRFLNNMKANPDNAAAPDFGDGKAKTPSGNNTSIFYAKNEKKERVALTYAQVYAILKRKMNSQELYQDLLDGKFGGLKGDQEVVSRYGDTLGVRNIYRNKEGAMFHGKDALVEKAREDKIAKEAKKSSKKPAPKSAPVKESVPKAKPVQAAPKSPPRGTSPQASSGESESMQVAGAPQNVIRAPSGILIYG